ncbi:MAG: 50S ribosomal protein L21 [Alphaproteobacteria bacterium]|nr:50S ribosomal protein L21 [Alphaproteobacteria bacterium]MCB9694836.1 50S ribosomal protein L21 [Alphaproteobacteria bacterium]
MFAIVETCGKQYRVEKGATITVDRMDAEEGAEITLDRVLLVAGDGVKVGAPTVEGATVTAKVTGHPRGEKVVAFKFRRRHRSRRRVGFRHSHTTLEITDIKG